MFNEYNSGVYVYLRVSTKSQEKDTYGLENQKKVCELYIKENLGPLKNFNIQYYIDIASSYNDPNALKKLNKLMRNINNKSILLVGDVSRLGRNCFQVFTLLRKIKKSNSIIIAINDNLIFNNSNRLMDKKFYNKIIEAEYSSDLKSIKSKERACFIKKNNGYLGKAFYGTQIIKTNNIPKLFKNSKEIDNVLLMKSQYKTLKDFDMVADYMNLNNKLNKNNVNWTGNTIKSILKKFYPNLLVNPNTNTINKQIIDLPDSPNNSDNIDIISFNNIII